MSTYQLEFQKKEAVAESIFSLYFKRPELFNYTAGQFIQMELPHPNADDRGTKRWFTLSSSPSQPFLTITTKLAASHPSSFKDTLFNLKPGTSLTISEADGDFTLPANSKQSLLFVAGGIGVTPFHSMSQWLLDNHQTRDITLLYGVQTQAELAFSSLFGQVGINLRAIIGERLTAPMILEAAGDQRLVYISGPEPMVEQLHDQLLAAGLPKERLKTDYFPGYQNLYSH